jgi:hypothetical protein
LRRGDYNRVVLDQPHGLHAFSRSLGGEKTLVAMNISDKTINAELPVQTLWREGQSLRSLLENHPFTVINGKIKLSLPAWSGIYLG